MSPEQGMIGVSFPNELTDLPAHGAGLLGQQAQAALAREAVPYGRKSYGRHAASMRRPILGPLLVTLNQK